MNAALAKAIERFTQITGNMDGWATIDEIVSLCDDASFWTDGFLADAEDKAKKSVVRRLIKSIRGIDSAPEWASVLTTDDDGKPQRIYKQETLFDVEDYRQVVTYHADRSRYHRITAEGYAKRCKQRFNVQLRMTFDDRKPR